MEAKFAKEYAGRPAAGGLQDRYQITASAKSAIPFGAGVVRGLADSGSVGVYSSLGADNTSVFRGFAVYSQEATNWESNHGAGSSGPVPKNAIYPEAYAIGDVVGVLTRGNIVVQIDEGSTGIKQGDKIVVTVDGTIMAESEITEVTPGTSLVFAVDAVALSDGSPTEYIGIDVFGVAASVITI